MTFLTEESDKSRDELRRLDSVRETIKSLREDLKTSKANEEELRVELADARAVHRQKWEQLEHTKAFLLLQNDVLRESIDAHEEEKETWGRKFEALQREISG